MKRSAKASNRRRVRRLVDGDKNLHAWAQECAKTQAALRSGFYSRHPEVTQP